MAKHSKHHKTKNRTKSKAKESEESVYKRNLLIFGGAGLAVLAIVLVIMFLVPSFGPSAKFHAAADWQCRSETFSVTIAGVSTEITNLADTDSEAATETAGTVSWKEVGIVKTVSDYCIDDSGNSPYTTSPAAEPTNRLVEVYCCDGAESTPCIWKAQVIDCTSTADACGTGVDLNCKCKQGRCTTS